MKKIIYVLVSLFVAGCQPTLTVEFEDKPVVSCFLDADASPVLTISKLIAFRDDATYSDENVNALSMTITDETEDISYPMQPVGNGGKYENPLLIIQAGHTYRLDFTYNRKPVTSIATVPDKPQNVEFSTAEVGVFNRTFTWGSSWNWDDLPEFVGQLEITWENDDKNFYIVECVTASSDVVNENQTDAPKTFKLDYTQNDYAVLSSMQFRYYGDYEVSLVRIQPEYAVMSEGSTNTYTSTTIDDVKGNIDGGYGIFTGISRITQTINVYEVEIEESTD
jgi:hypothetical protein